MATAKNQNKTTLKMAPEHKRAWFVFDASGKTLGRFASEVAKVLRGKHRPEFTPFTDTGDGVIVINAEKICVTGSKRAQKIYRNYTGSISGLREVNFEHMLAKKPQEIIRRAVKGMMPDNRLTNAQMKHLRIFEGPEHDLEAQKPNQVQI